MHVTHFACLAQKFIGAGNSSHPPFKQLRIGRRCKKVPLFWIAFVPAGAAGHEASWHRKAWQLRDVLWPVVLGCHNSQMIEVFEDNHVRARSQQREKKSAMTAAHAAKQLRGGATPATRAPATAQLATVAPSHCPGKTGGRLRRRSYGTEKVSINVGSTSRREHPTPLPACPPGCAARLVVQPCFRG